MVVKIVLLLVFFAVMIGVGVYCRKSAAGVQGFVLGGRNVGSWLTAFAFGTSYFSAVIFVGYAGQFGWKYGMSATWIGLGNALIGSLLAWRILGRRTRLMTQYLGSATMPDFFGQRFGSGALKVAASVIVFVFLVPYTASLYNGLSRLFGMAFGIDYAWCVLGMAVLTGAYVLLGGYMATAVNDFIQGLIMLVGIVAVVAAVLNGNGGFSEAINRLSQIPSEAAPGLNGAFVSFLGPQPLWLLGVVLLTSLGTWGLPQMVGKFYAIRDEAAIRKGTFISTFFAIVVAGGCYFLGGFGRLYAGAIEYTAAGTPVYDSIDADARHPFSGCVAGGQDDVGKVAAALHPSAGAVLHRGVERAGRCAGQEFGDVHCAADGYLVGCVGRCFPGAVPLWSLLEAYHACSRVGQLRCRCRRDVRLHVWYLHTPYVHQPLPVVAHQRGRAGHAARVGGCAPCKCRYAREEQGSRAGHVPVLRPHRHCTRRGTIED